MLTEFDSLVKQRQQLKSWWSLGSTIAQYDRKCHSLRVDVMKPTMVAYCGQAYAGAKNYHDAPDFFFEAINKEIQSRIKEITKDAYEKEIARLDGLIEKHRASVLSELSKE